MKQLLSITILFLMFLPILFPIYAYDKGVAYLELRGIIDRGVADYIKRSLQIAEPNPVILVLDTQGGYLSPLSDIIRMLKEYPGKLIVWIPPGGKAGSAGVFIALSAEKLYVSRSSVMGAAQPRPADPKTLNFTVAWIRALAEEKYSPADPRVSIAEEFVTKNRALTGEEAHELGIADGRAERLKDILESEGLTDYEIIELKPGLVEEMLSLIGDPAVAVLLIMVGILAIYVELTITGFQGLAIAGFLLIAAGVYGLGLLGLDTLIAAILLSGIAFLVAELAYPGLQFFGFLGVIMIILSVYLAYWQQPYVGPSAYFDVVIPLLFLISGIVAYMGFKIGKILKTPTPSLREALIGKIGVAKTKITPREKGVVLVEGEEWTAYSFAEEIDEGEKVEVVDIKGLSLVVRKAA